MHLFQPGYYPLPEAHLWPHADRFDIHMQVPRVEFAKLRDVRPGENSVKERVRVEAARELQRQRCEETSIARGHQEAVVTLVERKSRFFKNGFGFSEPAVISWPPHE